VSRVTDVLDLLETEAAKDPGLDVLCCLVRYCGRALGAAGVGLTLVLPDGGPHLQLAVSNAQAARVEDIQLDVGVGPGVECARTGKPVMCTNLRSAAPAQWLGFSDRAITVGAVAVFAFPVMLASGIAGVLSVHLRRPGRLAARHLDEVRLYVAAAAVVIAGYRPTADARLTRTLALASDRLEPLHVAVGMVMVQATTTDGEALALLRARSFSTGRALLAVSADVVAKTIIIDAL